MKIGLYFGSFNPIHVGHLVIANYMAEHSDLNEIWFVVTPHNPFKKKASLLDNYQRLEMVDLATKDFDKLKPSDIEFNLPQPNYTVNTLAYIGEKYPKKEFALIMGEDNLKHFHKWKNHEVILENHHIYVYPRIAAGQIETRFNAHPKIHKIDAPIMELSSTYIRKAIKTGINIKPMLDTKVWNYIDSTGAYL